MNDLDVTDEPAGGERDDALQKLREADAAAEEYEPTPRERLSAALGWYKGGDVTALAEIRALLRETGIWENASDLERKARRAWLEVAAGREDTLVRESLALRLAALRESLAGGKPTALEALVVEQACLAWLETCHMEIRDAKAFNEAENHGRQDFLAKRVERGHRRLMATLKTLATIRKLRPAPSPLDLLNAVPETPGEERGRGQGAPSRLRGEAVGS